MIFRPIKHLLFLLSLLFTVSGSLAQPTIVDIAITGPNPTNDPTLTWNVIFSEPVAGVSQANFTLNATGTAGTLTTVTALAGNQTWAVTVDGVSGTGTLGVDLSNPAGIMGTTAPLTGTRVGDLYDVDNTQPQVVSITRIDASPTSASAVSFAVLFTEPVYSVSEINFAPSGSLSGTVEAPTTSDSLTWIVTVSGISGSGTIGVDLSDTSNIVDAAGNPLFSDFTGGEQYTIDRTGPQYVCATRLNASSTSATTVRFLVEFDEPTSGVQTTNFTVSGSGTTGSVSLVEPGPTPEAWIVTVDMVDGQGTLGLDLTDPSGIVDAFGNESTSTGASCEFYDVDRVGPQITSIVLPDDSPTSAPTITFLIFYDEAVTNPTLPDDLTLITNGTTGTISGVETVGNMTTVTVTGVSGAGTMCLQVNAPTTITDLVGNPVSNVPISSGCYVICEDVPPVTNSVPYDGETTNSTVPFIEWVAPAPDLEYIIYFDGVLQGSTTGTQFAIPGPLSPGQHSYLIDVAGACTSGTEVVFNVLDQPVLRFPFDGFESCNVPRAFDWDPVEGATSYTVLVNGNVVGTTTGTELLTSAPLSLAPGTYTWTLIAANEFGGISASATFVILDGDAFDPTVLLTNGTIYTVEQVGSTIYVGGEFGLVYSGGTWVARNNVAAFDTSGTLLGWNPNVNGAIYAIEPTSTSLLLGGNFTFINGEPRARIAAVDTITSGVQPFGPGANNTVRAIEVVGNSVFFGGDFTRVNSQSFNFASPGIDAVRLARADLGSTASSAVRLVGNEPNASVRDLLYDGSHLYVAGVFSQISGAPIRGLAQFTVGADGSLTRVVDFNLSIDLYVYTLERVADRLYFGGSFNSVLGQERLNVAAIENPDVVSSRTLTAWNPRTDSAVHDIEAVSNGSTIYIGGTFTTVKQARSAYLAGVDPVFGFLQTCEFNSDRVIYGIQSISENGLSASNVIAGGQGTQTGAMTAP